jgi:RNA polymerase sigma-70 factor, ECF subfamily
MSDARGAAPNPSPNSGPRIFSHFDTLSRPDTVLPPPATDPNGLPNAELLAAIPRLRRYARVLTGDAVRADDLVQDTLARAWEKRRLWRAGSDLRAWLFTIMHNVHVNQLAQVRRDAANLSIDADPGNTAWQLPVRANQVERVELMEIVRQMGRLSEDQREVLLLAAVEELRYEEIAVVLSIPIGTVMSRLSRARDRLRRLMAEPTSPLRVVK